MTVKIQKGMVTYQLPVTPMVDLVFNLLLFYIMATTFDTEDRALKVTLPMAGGAKPLITEPQEMRVNIDQEGRYFVAGQEVELAELQQRFTQESVDNPGRARVIVRADERCYWRYIAAAMDACIQAGISDYRVMSRGAP